MTHNIGISHISPEVNYTHPVNTDELPNTPDTTEIRISGDTGDAPNNDAVLEHPPC